MASGCTRLVDLALHGAQVGVLLRLTLIPAAVSAPPRRTAPKPHGGAILRLADVRWIVLGPVGWQASALR